MNFNRFFFFFQAEDGIRDGTVTGVQTCALPIFSLKALKPSSVNGAGERSSQAAKDVNGRPAFLMISAIFSKPCFSGITLEKRTRSRVKPGSAPTPQEYWLTPGMKR